MNLALFNRFIVHLWTSPLQIAGYISVATGPYLLLKRQTLYTFWVVGDGLDVLSAY